MPSLSLSPPIPNLLNPIHSFPSSPNLSPRSVNLRRVDCSAACVASAAATTPCSSFYDVLGIPAGASNDEIRTAYRRLARVCHPDVAGRSAADTFMEVHAAYSTLNDPMKRANYDRSLFVIRPDMMEARFYGNSTSSPSSTSTFSRSPRKNWESDQCW